jgi:ribosomal protein S18 acetylase RimI-like enzyme
MSASYTLRPAQPEDAAFMLAAYASTRADEMALLDWSFEQKQAFVQMQYTAQAQHYASYYPTAEYFVIMGGQTMLGRLIVCRSPSDILMMDIALLPEYRHQGTGAAVISDLMAEAEQAGIPMRLHVETFNPALHLYERLGFSKTAESGFYLEMEWSPEEKTIHDR